MNNKINYNVTDLRSEILYREAEDDFYFFRKIKLAQRKLEKALEFSPFFVKAIILLANIAFYQGKIDEVLEYYKHAEQIDGKNINVLAGLANINEILENYSKALDYVNDALSHKGFVSSNLYNMLIELKISILINLKRYNEADELLHRDALYTDLAEIQDIRVKNLYLLKHKLDLQQKIEVRRLKLVK